MRFLNLPVVIALLYYYTSFFHNYNSSNYSKNCGKSGKVYRISDGDSYEDSWGEQLNLGDI